MINIAIDNGVTGCITMLDDQCQVITFQPMPVKTEQSYTKKKQNITRIDGNKLLAIFEKYLEKGKHCFCLLERPFTGGVKMFKATVSGMRALEATLVILEQLGIPFRYIDSKEWQGAMLPKGMKKGGTKKAAVDIAKRFFPDIKTKDADSLLMALYAARKGTI